MIVMVMMMKFEGKKLRMKCLREAAKVVKPVQNMGNFQERSYTNYKYSKHEHGKIDH